MTNERLSLLLQIAGLLIVVAFSLFTQRLKISLIFAVTITVIVAIVAQFMIAGGGPAACMSVLALPMIGCFFAWLTFIVKQQLSKQKLKSDE